MLPKLLVQLPAATAAPTAHDAGLSRFEPGIPDLPALFANPKRTYRLEIGFGGGEHLIHRALEHPDIGFIGVEPFVNVNGEAPGRGREARPHQYPRLRQGRYALLLRRLPEASLEEICLLYPDPWPKRRQRKRRFVSTRRLRSLRGLFSRAALSVSRAISTTMSAGRSSAAMNAPDLLWQAEAARDWTTPYSRLAGHPLRGEGDTRGTGAELSDVPEVGANPRALKRGGLPFPVDVFAGEDVAQQLFGSRLRQPPEAVLELFQCARTGTLFAHHDKQAAHRRPSEGQGPRQDDEQS